jgi:hypothetical protein
MPVRAGCRPRTIFHQAPQDGTTIGIVHSRRAARAALGSKGVRRHPQVQLARQSPPRSLHLLNASPIKTWADMLKERTVGSSGAGSQMETYPAILNKLFGTKIRVIAGYKDGGAVCIALGASSTAAAVSSP